MTKLQSGHRLPYSRMSKNNKTHQPKGNKKTVAEEEKGNNLQEPPKEELAPGFSPMQTTENSGN